MHKNTFPSAYDIFIKAIETQLGMDIKTIRATPLENSRIDRENFFSKPMKFVSYFPLIGRGTMLADRTIDHLSVEKQLDKALK